MSRDYRLLFKLAILIITGAATISANETFERREYEYFSISRNFKGAFSECSRLGFDGLATFTSKSEQDRIATPPLTNSTNLPYAWFGLEKNCGNFKWSDGTDLNFTAFREREIQRDCMEIRYLSSRREEGIFWSDNFCSAVRPFFCVRISRVFTASNGHTFARYFRPFGITAEEAELSCQEYGYEGLAIMENVDTYLEVLETFKNFGPKASNYWIGLYDIYRNSTFYWAKDPSKLLAYDTSLFYKGQPSNFRGRQDCAGISQQRLESFLSSPVPTAFDCNENGCDSTNRTVRDLDCSQGHQGFICSAAVVCRPGFYCPPSGGEIECELGSYCPSAITEPRSCLEGHACPTPSVQIPCALGSYCPERTINEAPCPVGSFCPSPDVIQPCNPGSYCPQGSLTEKQCSEEHHCRTPEFQVPCRVTNYCPTGSINENLCPAGFYCLTTINQTECPAGSYCPEGSTAATLCPSGSNSDPGQEDISGCKCEGDFSGELREKGDSCNRGDAKIDWTFAAFIVAFAVALVIFMHGLFTTKLARDALKVLLEDVVTVALSYASGFLKTGTDIATLTEIILPSPDLEHYTYPVIAFIAVGTLTLLWGTVQSIRVLEDSHKRAGFHPEERKKQIFQNVAKEKGRYNCKKFDEIIAQHEDIEDFNTVAPGSPWGVVFSTIVRTQSSGGDDELNEKNKTTGIAEPENGLREEAEEGEKGEEGTEEEGKRESSIVVEERKKHIPDDDPEEAIEEKRPRGKVLPTTITVIPTTNKRTKMDLGDAPSVLCETILFAIARNGLQRRLTVIHSVVVLLQVVPMFVIFAGPVMSYGSESDIKSFPFRASLILGAISIGMNVAKGMGYMTIKTVEDELRRILCLLCMTVLDLRTTGPGNADDRHREIKIDDLHREISRVLSMGGQRSILFDSDGRASGLMRSSAQSYRFH